MRYSVILGSADDTGLQVAIFEAESHDHLREELTKAFSDPEWWGHGCRFVAVVEGDAWIGLRDDVQGERWFSDNH
jgi:hypothetical protein